MRKMILTLALLYPAAAFAQGTTAPAPTASPPPTASGGKPLVQVGTKKPAAAKKEAAGKKEAPKSIAQKLQACGDIDDATKERLQCYDAIFTPQPETEWRAGRQGRQ